MIDVAAVARLVIEVICDEHADDAGHKRIWVPSDPENAQHLASMLVMGIASSLVPPPCEECNGTGEIDTSATCSKPVHSCCGGCSRPCPSCCGDPFDD